MIEKIKCVCTFCKSTREFVSEIPDTTRLGLNLKKWIPALCCDRCGTFQNQKMKLTDRIVKACYLLCLAKANESKKPVDIGKFREVFERLTREISKLICDYYRFELVISDEFPELLMNNPSKSRIIISKYIQ